MTTQTEKHDTTGAAIDNGALTDADALADLNGTRRPDHPTGNATIQALSLVTLPALGSPLEGGTFAGVITKKNGAHCAVILLPEQGADLNWKNALAWAEKQGGELPTRPVAAMLFANVKDKLQPHWHWTSEENASYAWLCYFDCGNQNGNHKSYEGSAVAVRLIPITA